MTSTLNFRTSQNNFQTWVSERRFFTFLRPDDPAGVGGSDDVSGVVAGLRPDAGHRLGLSPRLVVGEVVDDLAGGGVDDLDAAVQQADTDVCPVLRVPQ